VPSSVTSIGNNCFQSCTSLTSITIPSSVTSIGASCFKSCTSLTSITIPSSVTTIGNNCFQSCTSLTSITIPDSITVLNASCFEGCSMLASINIPSSVTSLGSLCFYSCVNLTSISIPSSVTSIGNNCFQNCTGLTSITIPNSVTSIGGLCFQSCTGLTSITLPSSVTSIDTSCFQNCTSLASITIPSIVTSIGINCFQRCTSLTSITIPNSVTSIGEGCFINCTSLITVSIENQSTCTVFTNSFTNVSSNLNSTITYYKTANQSQLTSNWSTIKNNYRQVIYNPNPISPTITDFSIPTKTYGNLPFTITQPQSNSSGSFTYTSSNLSVATISGNIVTIVGAGSSTITATQAATENYSEGTITATFQVNQATPTITDFSIPTKTYGDAPFTITQPQSTSPGSFTYTSSNLSVATISGNIVTIVGSGSSILTATQAATDNYEEGIITATFQVNQATPTITNFSIPTKTYGDTPFTITPPTSNSSGSFTYSSSNLSAATISGSTITIVGAGTSIITATQAETANFTSGTITGTFQVNKATTTMTDFSISTKTYGDAPFTITQPQSNSPASVSYTSSNLSVATVSGNTITIVGAGSSTITANQAATTNYTSGTITALFQVNQATPTITDFSIPTKTYSDTPFTITPPQSNSPGSFTYTSSDLSVATISGNIVTIVGAGSSTITATQAGTTNFTSGTITAPLQVTKATTILTDFSIPIKINGDPPFEITPPTSNRDGSFSYASSNLSVAIVSENTITIVGAGYTIITATQVATDNYEEGIIETTFNVTYVIATVEEFEYFLQTDVTYGIITESIVIASDLTSYSSKVITANENVKIIKSLIG
jgi:uncharacterized protein YjdB